MLPNKSYAPNSATMPQFQIGHQWRGIGDPNRSAE